jgi:hypothetical protein
MSTDHLTAGGAAGPRRQARWLAVLLAGICAGCTGLGAADPAATAVADPKGQLERMLRSDPEQQAADAAQYQRRLNDRMAQCLRDDGFEYRPVSPVAQGQDRLGLSEEDFVEQYGFGIATLIGVQAANSAPADPNRAIREALSPAEQKAYDRALRRCTESVRRELGPAPGRLELPADISAGVNEATRRAEADTRVVAAKQAYARCVAKRGFAGSSGEALRGQIEERAAPLRQAYQSREAELLGQGRDVSTLRVQDVLDAGQLAELTRLRQLELRAAAADRECGADLYRTAAQVQKEYLRKYVDGLG